MADYSPRGPQALPSTTPLTEEQRNTFGVMNGDRWYGFSSPSISCSGLWGFKGKQYLVPAPEECMVVWESQGAWRCSESGPPLQEAGLECCSYRIF